MWVCLLLYVSVCGCMCSFNIFNSAINRSDIFSYFDTHTRILTWRHFKDNWFRMLQDNTYKHILLHIHTYQHTYRQTYVYNGDCFVNLFPKCYCFSSSFSLSLHVIVVVVVAKAVKFFLFFAFFCFYFLHYKSIIPKGVKRKVIRLQNKQTNKQATKQ